MESDVCFNDYFYYDETSPSCLRWKVSRYTGNVYQVCRVSAGDVAGNITTKGYWDVTLNNKVYKVHRVIIYLHGLSCYGVQVDHINQDKGDNKFSNLRLVSGIVNRRNASKNCNNSSGVTGVSLQSSKGEYKCFKAFWSDENGLLKTKSFSIKKYGFESAFDLACKARMEAIKELNKSGAGYTARHGL